MVCKQNDNSFSGNQQQYYLHHPAREISNPTLAPLAGTSADKAKNDEGSMYSNPSSGIFNVKLPDNEQVKTIQVFNAVGEKVLTKRFRGKPGQYSKRNVCCEDL